MSGAGLVLGPLLRYTGTESATFWLETDAPYEVEILAGRAVLEGRVATAPLRRSPQEGGDTERLIADRPLELTR